MCLGDFNGHVGRHINGFGRKNISFVWRKNYVYQIHSL